jgi:hypothetical protein
MTDPNAKPKPRLSAEGHVFVSLAAAQQYARAMRMDDVRELEEARRDLTELMLDAYRTDGDSVRMRHRIEKSIDEFLRGGYC